MPNSKTKPARTPQGKESQMINLAYKLAEKKLRDGTASSQLISHFLKLGTKREELELERIRSDIAVADAKIQKMNADVNSQSLYEEAIRAFRSYAGQKEDEEDEEDE